MSELTKFDSYLNDNGPAALVIREWLMPVEGTDGVLFPATFAPAEDKGKFAGGYNIDNFEDTCLAPIGKLLPGAALAAIRRPSDVMRQMQCLALRSRWR